MDAKSFIKLLDKLMYANKREYHAKEKAKKNRAIPIGEL